MTNTDTADIDATVSQVAALFRAGSEIVRITVDRDESAAAVPKIRERLLRLGMDVPLVSDFHYIGHKLLADHPACAEALAKYRINPGNVGFKDKKDKQFGEIVEMAIRYDKPVRIGVNWGSLDQELLTTLMDRNKEKGFPLSARQVTREAIVQSALISAELAEEIGLSQWFIKPEAETVLRELGERGDIIKRMHRALIARGIERGSASYVLAGESLDVPVIGRLVERGLDDELKGTAYAVVDGVDGRTHHIKLPHLDAAGDSPPGSIVELRAYEDAQGARRVALAVRSDLDLGAQVGASGATWLDRQAIAREPVPLSDSGFGAEVRQALDERAEHLIGEDLAERQGGRVVFARRLLNTLRRRELDSLGEKLAAETGMSFERAASGEYVAGSYRQRFALASGRFAMIDDGLGFQLVPWSPSIEKQIGRHVSGIARDDGGVDWDFGRKRGLGL